MTCWWTTFRDVFGIRGTALAFFRSYLSGRKQTVSVVGHESEPSSLLYGVPRGLVLGPVLFIVYTQPLSAIIERHSVLHHMFVMNCAASLVCKAFKREHTKPLLVNLHWLPAARTIEYNIATVCYNVITCTAPPLSVWPPWTVHPITHPPLLCWHSRLPYFEQTSKVLLSLREQSIRAHQLSARDQNSAVMITGRALVYVRKARTLPVKKSAQFYFR